MQAWLGPSCARVTLDVLEWGTVLPEVFRVGPRHPPPSPVKGGLALPLEPAPPLHDSSSQAPEQSYGLLSIDTVTVAGGPAGCCPHGSCASLCSPLGQWPEGAAESQGTYRGLDLGLGLDLDGSAEGQAPAGLLLQDVLLQSEALRGSGRGSPPVLLQAGCALGRAAQEGGPFLGWPLEPWGVGGSPGLSSPGEERLFFGDLPSPDGDPGTGLDLDTIDSGFADSGCTSPVDCEFEPGPSSCGAELGAGDREEAFLPSYVKQWVSGHSRTLPS